VFYEIGAAREALLFYRDLISTAPGQLGAFFGFHLAPPLPFLPTDRHGQPMCVIVACYAGETTRHYPATTRQRPGNYPTTRILSVRLSGSDKMWVTA
jgi:hypothetical protein